MRKLAAWLSVVCVAIFASFGSSCKKPGVDEATVEGASKLPGAAEVMSAIEKKDYDGAMAALSKVKEGVTTEEQNVQFMVLARQARDKMGEAAATDPKAAAAVNALRAMSTGGR
jgi:hypothetical protein